MKQTFVRVFTSVKVWTALIGLVCTAGGTLLAKWGFDASMEAQQQTAITISGIFAILLHAQGKTDQGREAARVQASTPSTSSVAVNGTLVETTTTGPTSTTGPSSAPTSVLSSDAMTPPMGTRSAQSGVITSELAILIGGSLLIGLALSACGWLKSEGKAAAHDVVDCTVKSTVKLVQEFAPVMDELVSNALDSSGNLDAPTLKERVKNFAPQTGGCVLAATLKRWATPGAPKPGAPQSSQLVANPDQLNAFLHDIYPGKTFKLEATTE